ncbi:MAG: CoA protein activase [Nitrospirae bacterium]|nr:CoA protein activase [Nitrospirota bacterium]
MEKFIGLDAGSVSIKLVVMDNEAKILYTIYERHKGHPLTVTLQLLKNILGNNGNALSPSMSITGSAGKLIADILGVKHVNEIVAQPLAVRRFLPSVKTIFEMGGEDSKLIILNDTGIEDFSMNSVCAAGTGSFLDQQAERLRISIEEFSEIALKSKNPPRIAGRCSVFAKSDMIHLQQIATPLEDIVAGLCFAVARNFKGSIIKGRKVIPQVSFQGGVAANSGIVRAFREIFDVDEIIVPKYFAFMGAIGAALKDIKSNTRNAFYIKNLEDQINSIRISGNGKSPLIIEGDDFFRRHLQNADCGIKSEIRNPESEIINAYLGIDIGSISTNLALIDEGGNLLSKRYLMTSGRPIDAVMQGLREVGEDIGDNVEILGVGTTGSGRYMIADFVGADIVKNEITAQARAAIFIDENVDTIFEIGGQDSKYISIEDGVVVDFEMNKACAAGTGSFLEEQAEKLNVSIKEEFASFAFSSKHPCALGERCTVFMENSLMANLQQGVQKDDLLAGLAYSIVENYINRVVSYKKIGKNIFFQGGTAFNKSVVAAFEKFTGQRITVPPNHDVTGAIGMALIAKEYMENKKSGELCTLNPEQQNLCATNFKGFELSNRSYSISSFGCKGCSNVCEINKISMEGEKEHLYYGGRCEKYDIRKKDKPDIENLFAFREALLWKEYKQESIPKSQHSKVIGIPYIFFFQDYLPFWTTLLYELGFDIVVSPKTNRQVVNLGTETVLSETCFPVKVAHGHIKYLLENDIKNVFLPSFVSFSDSNNYFDKKSPCPYTQTIPYLAKVAFRDANILSPIIDFRWGDDFIVKEIGSAFKKFHISNKKLNIALMKARENQKNFNWLIQEKGKEILSSLKDKAVVIVGRAYNSFDNGVNLQIPQKLATLNVFSIPMDFLPLNDIDITDRWPQMYWKNGKEIIQAARFIRNNPMLYPIYIGNFNCGPDSFIFEYFKEEIGDKPFLFLEIDEHSADAGAITRCEAFLDGIENRKAVNKQRIASRKSAKKIMKSETMRLSEKKVFIPKMCDHGYALAAAFEFSGISVEVLPEPDRETMEIGRKYVSGKQCFPCVLTIGEMLKKIFSADLKSNSYAFFMPAGTGPCRFGQYNIFQRLVLERLGLNNVQIFSPIQDRTFYNDLGIAGDDFIRRAWKGIISIEMLTKCLHETRPYEKEKGLTDYIYNESLTKVYNALRGRNGGLEKLLNQICRDFDSIPKYRDKKPLIGIIGEIFVRSNKFTNENLINKIESLGGEVWLSPPEEWLYYINHIGLKHALIKRDIPSVIRLFLKNHIQNKTEHKYGSIFKNSLKTLREPSTREILKKAMPYVHHSFEGETILSVGKAIDLIEKGASGIVNAMPFGCMPGTIVTALLRAISKDYNIPSISMPYDGTESVTTEIQLEAFMHQAKENSIKKCQSIRVSKL